VSRGVKVEFWEYGTKKSILRLRSPGDDYPSVEMLVINFGLILNTCLIDFTLSIIGDCFDLRGYPSETFVTA